MSENKIARQTRVPRLRFPEFRLSNGWTSKQLDDICDVNPCCASLPDSFVYIDLESVENGFLKAKKIINLSDAPSRAQRLLKMGDVIYQTVRPYQRNNLFFSFEDNQYIASTGYAQLRAREIPGFLYQLIHTDNFVKKVIGKCTGSSYPAINASDLAKIYIAIPQPKEQQKIADCLSSLDDLIAVEMQKLNTLKTHKKGLMQQLFPRECEAVPRLRFPEFINSGAWNKNILGDLCIAISSGKDKFNNDGTFKLYGSTGVIGKTKSCSYVGEYILVARVGANAGFLNKVNGQFGVTDNTLVIYLKDGINLNYIYFYLLGFNLNKLVFGTGQPLVTGNQLNLLDIYYPSDVEQKLISDILSSLDDLITVETQKLEILKTHKKSLMQQLFPITDEVLA
jgi:type I restriction enzyme S subunit